MQVKNVAFPWSVKAVPYLSRGELEQLIPRKSKPVARSFSTP